MLDLAHRRGLAVELNTRFLYRDHSDEAKKKYLEANSRLVRKAKARGVGIAVGSDAHSPKDQGNGFDVVLKLLDDARVNELVFPVGGRLARVALRATREHLEAQAKARRQPSAPGSSISGFSRAELGLPEEAEGAGSRREGARAGRETGPKKRGVKAARTTKKPGATPPSPPSTSRRSVESSASAGKAKAARGAKPQPPAKKKTPKRPEATPKKHVRPAAPAKVKKAAVKPPRPAAKKSSSAKAQGKKGPTRKTTAQKARKAAVKKPAPRRVLKPKRLVAGSAKKAVKKKKTAAKRR